MGTKALDNQVNLILALNQALKDCHDSGLYVYADGRDLVVILMESRNVRELRGNDEMARLHMRGDNLRL